MGRTDEGGGEGRIATPSGEGAGGAGSEAFGRTSEGEETASRRGDQRRMGLFNERFATAARTAEAQRVAMQQHIA